MLSIDEMLRIKSLVNGRVEDKVQDKVQDRCIGVKGST